MATSTKSTTALPDKAPTADNGTRLTDDNTMPPVTQPGDAPADTKDPTEHASTVLPNPGPEARAAGVVNAVVPIDPPNGGFDPSKPAAVEGGGRVEEYTYLGKRIRHNIDTGATEVLGDAKAEPSKPVPATA